jgi:uncharacterized protein (DUF1800 family)
MTTQSARWIATARGLRRAGFGASGPQIDAIAAEDWSAYLDTALDADPDKDPGARKTPLPAFDTPPRPGKTATKAARQQYAAQLSAQMTELSAWWLRRMTAVGDPIHEKLTLLWHNHFATSANKVRAAAYMGVQNQTLRTLKLGDFRTLAYAMLTDAAMLRWLDGQTNTAKAANENLAREFMELFALGHGNGYTETDVREGARALTGWVIAANGTTELAPRRHDHTDKIVLGVRGNLDAQGFCDAVLAQPKSAPYIATRLWTQLAGDDPPSDAALGRLVGAYGPRRDLKALTTAVLTDPEFLGTRATVVTAPADWLVGVVRTLNVPLDTDARVRLVDRTLTGLGHRPFYPPDVGGWPRGRVWLTTVSADTRLRVAAELAKAGDLSKVTDAAATDRLDAAGYLLGIGGWSDRTAAALKPLTANPPRLIAAAVNTPEYLTS